MTMTKSTADTASTATSTKIKGNKPTRRMAREPQSAVASGAPAAAPAATPAAHAKAKPPSRLDQLEQLLLRAKGASIAEMMEATGWQQHSVRGAMAGALKKKRGLTITSEKLGGLRRYHAKKPA